MMAHLVESGSLTLEDVPEAQKALLRIEAEEKSR
jgi:hypothetical protein